MRLLCLAIVFSFLSDADYSWAHGDPIGSCSTEACELLEIPEIAELAHHLQVMRDQSIRGGIPNDEQTVRIGETVTDAAFAAFEKHVKEDEQAWQMWHEGKSASHWPAVQARREFWHHWNPGALYKKLAEKYRESVGAKGTILGTLIFSAQALEDTMFMYAITYGIFNHHHWYTRILLMSHPMDLMAFSIYGLPIIISRVNLWRRHGGPLQGISGYHQHLVTQRQFTPIDWSQVIAAPILPIKGSAGIEQTRVMVVKDSFIDRQFAKLENVSSLARYLRMIFYSKRMALREAQPTLTIREIEKAAAFGAIDIRLFSSFRAIPNLYVTMLLRQILHSEKATTALTEALRGLTMNTFPSVALVRIDVQKILQATDAKALSDLGESPDIIAQQVLWYLEHKRNELYAWGLAQPKGLSKDVRALFKKFKKLITKKEGLNSIAATNYRQAASGHDSFDWAFLLKQAQDAFAILADIKNSLPQRSSCDDVL